MNLDAPARIQCPSGEELRKLLRNRLPSQRESEVTAHLDECTACREKLDLMAEGDANISGTLRNIHQAEPPKDSAYWNAIEFVGSQVTSTFAATRTSDRKTLDFLRPTETEGKIGKLGGFEVSREIGRGGMGIVLQAHDPHLEREVALKVLDPNLAHNETARQRFCREARAAAAVTHENLVTVYSVNEDDVSKLPYFAMQLVIGETLEQRLRREGRLSVDATIKIALQAAQGLAAAHANGLIHRDIKPGNILLEAGTDKARLTDFGLARAAEDLKLTRTGFVAGTPLYMAPEQAKGEDVDARADLFSLGAVMYECLSGRPPFDGATPLAVLRRVADEAHPRLSRLNPDVPDWLEDVIDELLEKDPAKRLPSAEKLAEILNTHLSNQQCAVIQPVECTVARTASRIAGQRRKSRLITAAVLAVPFVIGGLSGALAAFSFMPPLEKLIEVPCPAPGSAAVATAAVTGPEPAKTYSFEHGPVASVAVAVNNTDQGTIATAIAGFEDGAFVVWTLEPFKTLITMNDAHDAPIWAVDISRDGTTAITASDDGTVKVWDIASAKVRQTLRHGTSVRSAALNHLGTQVVSGDRSGIIRVWEIDRDQPIQEVQHGGTINAVAFEPKGRSFASASTNRTVRIWEVATGRSTVTYGRHKGPVYSVSFDPDGELVASASWDKTIAVWEADNGKPRRNIPAHDDGVWSVSFSACGKILATAGQEGTVKVWNAQTGQSLASFHHHKGTVYSVKFLPGCAQILTGGRDGTVRLWNIDKAAHH